MSAAISWEEAVERLRADPARVDLVRACYFDDPAISAARRFHASAEWEAVRVLLGPSRGRRVLDVGAGRGIASFAFAADGWKTTALEPDPGLVVGRGAIEGIARESGLSIEVRPGLGESMPFESGRFEVVYLRQALHRAADLDALLRECHRVLTPGGKLLATREHVLSKPSDLPVFLAAHPLHALYGGEHAFTLARYLQAFQKAGFEGICSIGPNASALHAAPGPYVEPSMWRRTVAALRRPLDILRDRFARAPGRLHSFVAVRS